MSKTYGYKELIQIYIETRREHGPDLPEELLTYYPRLLSHLETAFGLQFSDEYVRETLTEFKKFVMFMLFKSTVTSYIAQRTPWSDYLEAGLLIKTLERQSSKGQEVLTTSDDIFNLVETSRKKHLEMLYQLFELIYGNNDTIVTSQQLLAQGFDDSKEPKSWEFTD